MQQHQRTTNNGKSVQRTKLNQNTIGEERKQEDKHFNIKKSEIGLKIVTNEENSDLPLETTRGNNNVDKNKKVTFIEDAVMDSNGTITIENAQAIEKSI